jgi:hypothetical protein
MIDANYGSVICLCSWCLSSVLGSAVGTAFINVPLGYSVFLKNIFLFKNSIFLNILMR